MGLKWANPYKYYSIYVDATPRAAGLVIGQSEHCLEFSRPMTCNEAEYAAIMLGMEKALKKNIKRLIIYSDSQIAVEQINSNFKIKAQNLRFFWYGVQYLISQFDDVKVYHISGKENPADAISRKVLEVSGPGDTWLDDPECGDTEQDTPIQSNESDEHETSPGTLRY